jgi:hypothetical protein
MNGIMDTSGKIQEALEAHTGTFELLQETKANAEFMRKKLFFNPSHKDIGSQFIKQMFQIVF